LLRFLRNLMGGRKQDDRIKDLINEVGRELGVKGKNGMTSREVDQLGEEIKREIRKRT
jgi:hypothetical protein